MGVKLHDVNRRIGHQYDKLNIVSGKMLTLWLYSPYGIFICYFFLFSFSPSKLLFYGYTVCKIKKLIKIFEKKNE